MVLAVDIGLLLVVLLSLLSGWRSGFLDTLFSIAAWFGGILIAFHAAVPLQHALPGWTDLIPGVKIVVGVGVFLLSFAAIRLIGHLAGGGGRRPADPSGRGLGALLGIARGVLLVGILASLVVAFAPAESRILRESRVLPLVAPMSQTIAHAAPSWLRERMLLGWEHLRGARRTTEPRAVSAQFIEVVSEDADGNEQAREHQGRT